MESFETEIFPQFKKRKRKHTNFYKNPRSGYQCSVKFGKIHLHVSRIKFETSSNKRKQALDSCSKI